MVDYRGKTGARRVPIVFSVPFISNYINTYRLNAKPDDPFFVILMNNVPTDRPMNYDAFRILLRKLCNRTGIKKRIHPHLFRHSRATHMANTLTEQQLKMLFGWAGDSKMASVYVHLSGRDLDDAVLRANGLVSVNKEPEKPLLTLKRCLKCHSNNEATNKFCKNCGSPLDVSTKEQIERLENVDSMKDRMQRLERALDGIYQLLDAKIKKEIEG